MIKALLKLAVSYVIKVVLLPLYICPIKRNRIVFMSYSGTQYSCNPKYISDYIKDNCNDYEIIWAFVSPELFSLEPGIKKIKYLSLRYFYIVVTSKFCISNTGFNRFFIIRAGQKFIQTWHGGGAYKRRSSINVERNVFLKILDHQHDKMITDFISSSKYFTEYFIHDSVYNGNILNTGMPRNEYLIRNKSNKELLLEIRKKIADVKEEQFVVLYAPTWRDDGSSYAFPDFDTILKTIENKFKKKPLLLLRSHHFQSLSNTLTCEYLDVREYPYMQELLLASDMLISDYSSSIWDYSLLDKSCFLYTPDLKYYDDIRGFYTPIHSWGFDVCETSEELDLAIANFSQEKYNEKINKMHLEFGSYENKDSTSLLLKKLEII